MKRKAILRRERFDDEQDEPAAQFLSSLSQDERILDADIWLDRAHAAMLNRCGILNDKYTHKILQALDDIEAADRETLFSREVEDVHILLETELIDRLGEEIGGRLHTARSRNDEVAACIRMALRSEVFDILRAITQLQRRLVGLAGDNLEAVMPGYTHLQHAQPTTLAHHLMSHATSLSRDASRMMDAYERMNLSPLGAAAMSSTSFPIDPETTAELLGFEGTLDNSIDAVSARDFLLEALSAVSILAVNLSRLSEELVLWSTSEFGFLRLSDRYSSTSSIMPQKRNPDVLELCRARTSTIVGSLVSALGVCKSLPAAYNRDLQEANSHLWKGVDTVKWVLRVMDGALSTATFHHERMEEAAGIGMIWATDLADRLVQDFDLPFRTAHSIVARISKDYERDKEPGSLVETLGSAIKEISGRDVAVDEKWISSVMDFQASIGMRKPAGGPSPASVRSTIRKISRAADRSERWTEERQRCLNSARDKLNEIRSRLEAHRA